MDQYELKRQVDRCQDLSDVEQLLIETTPWTRPMIKQFIRQAQMLAGLDNSPLQTLLNRLKR